MPYGEECYATFSYNIENGSTVVEIRKNERGEYSFSSTLDLFEIPGTGAPPSHVYSFENYTIERARQTIQEEYPGILPIFDELVKLFD